MPAAEWSRVVNTTMHQFIREEEVNILRNRKLLAMLKERGRISFNHSGDFMDWKVRYKRAPMQGFTDSDTLTFARRDRWKTAQLEWRGYAGTDSMTKRERLMNKNAEAIIKVFSQIGQNLMEDIEEHFGDELYVDGNASGNEKRMHGIESFMGVSGAASGGFIGVNDDSYAGLDTDLAAYGGTWSGTWPNGTGDSHYDFWTPLVVDYEDTAWAAATKTWPNTCLEALRYGIIKGKKNKSKKGMLDLILLNDELYRQFMDKLQTEEQINVDRTMKKGGLLSLGFSDVVNFDGVDVSSEYGVPETVGYGWAFEHMELRSLQGQLFVPEGPDFDIATQSYRFSIDSFCQARHNPRYFCKWDDIT
jgi:hypothetical protein